ncbi:MAG: acetylglutamate kinase [Rhodospirillales bacterium]|nr:acetylglutamate kinase [Rhodospirillales bacterium]
MDRRDIADKNIGVTKHWLRTAQTLAEALPYLRQFSGHTFVIKYGGHAMGDDELARDFARDIVLIKQVGINPIVVHGGGPQIGAMLKRMNIQSEFVDGLRVTDRESVDVVEMVLAGSINKQIVTAINEEGGRAIGISGKDGRLIEARKLRRTRRDTDSNIEKILDLGFVGEPRKVNAEVFRMFENSDAIPVIAPIGIGNDGDTYNINADTAAGAIAEAVNASKLLMLTDIAGVLDSEGSLISEMTRPEARELFQTGAITDGMIPKLETCLKALDNGVEAAHVLDGRIPHVLLLELFTADGTGTKINA